MENHKFVAKMHENAPNRILNFNKYERYYGPGRRSLAYFRGKPRLCINIHQYAPPRTVLQQAAATHAALYAVRRQYTAQCYREHLIR